MAIQYYRGQKMKWLEFFGVLLAAAGFGLLSMGFLKIGFIMGCFSVCLLIPVFYKQKLYFVVALQTYFGIMGAIGIFNNF